MAEDQSRDYHEQYHSINTGVHRKGGVKIITPTLTHHLGLWYPPVRSTTSQLSVTRFGPRVDAYVRAHFAAMRACPNFESNFSFTIDDDEIIGLFGDAYKILPDGGFELFEARSQPGHFGLKDAIDSDSRILFMKASWYGLVVIVRCEFRSEYATITRFVTLTDPEAVHPSIACFSNAPDVLLKLSQGVRCAESDVRDSHTALYGSIWDTLDRELFHCVDIFRPSVDAERCQIFADFRGIVVAGSDDPPGGTISLSRTKSDRPFSDGWPREGLIPSIWPFLTVREGLDLEHREFTASFMLDKRAVYITALGPQPVAPSRPQCAPVQYMLVARPVSDWQLGALVDRIHFLGTVRLAALMELKALRAAGANLRDMEHEAEMARRAIDDDKTAKALEHYRRAMDLIAHKSRDSGEPLFWAGLQFRVERSRYYVERFNEFIAFLDIDPIEGYPPYHHFVRARLGGVYDYINRLGQRQERAVRSAESISQLISLLEAAEANKQSAEANAQSAKANEQNSAISKTIEKLQTKAEIALLAVIVPHYAMDIVRAFQEEFEKNRHGIFAWYAAILSVGVILALASLIVYLVDIYRRDEWRFYEIVQKYAFLTIVSVAASIAIMHVPF